MVESAAFPGGYYRNTFEAAPDESEGSGSSAQIDTEVTASENSSTPARKCVKLSPDDEDPYGVQRQVISLYNMSQSERKDLIHRLKLELEQTKIVLKNAELQRSHHHVSAVRRGHLILQWDRERMFGTSLGRLLVDGTVAPRGSLSLPPKSLFPALLT
ncbi:BnaA06g32250D [Brassica napus]|uniref:BnaA06g32250D protein n=1 Tax=Brassica napus TaxID=3708 RepID=A0A078FMW3_BRANA|nr:BnaA06g32250D [Brassica napus]